MEKFPSRAFAPERGAILVQAAVSSLVLIGFASFVIDYGILWVSRNQAQNAADAGATAGALARAYDGDSTPAVGGPAWTSASVVAQANLVWNAPGTTVVGFTCPSWVSSDCVSVNVYRNGENGSQTLPTLFAPLLGITSQGVRATASAQVGIGNASDCLRPFAIPDKWDEGRPAPSTWTTDDQFERYVPSAPLGTLLAPADSYAPPNPLGPGSGLTTSDPPQMTIQFPPDGRVFPGWFQPLDLPGGKTYEQNIAECNGQVITVGQEIPISTAATAGPTTIEFTNLYAQDPGASWNTLTNRVEGSCAPACAPVSPRLVVVAVFDVDWYESMRAADDWTGCPGADPCIRIVNMLGFFIDDVSGPSVDGYLTNHPGLVSTTSATLHAQSSFLKAITLVR